MSDGEGRKLKRGRLGTFQVLVKESTSLKLLNGTKDLFPWRGSKITAYSDEKKSD